MSKKKPKFFLNLQQVADSLGITRHHAKELIKKEKIKHTIIKGTISNRNQWKIDSESMAKYKK
ncbi:MAG TPA: helix-turn-helix domain-containing protein [bacterium]|nr:helix-turn-helix domain-containing protein [bacterium]